MPPKTKDGKLSPRQLADELGVQHRAVQKAIESGRLDGAWERNARGHFRIDCEKASELWIANTARLTKPELDGKDPRNQLAAAALSATSQELRDLLQLAAGLSLHEAKTLLEAYRAKNEKLKFDRESGKLLPKEQVDREVFEIGIVIREALFAIPGRIHETLAVQDDPQVIYSLLMEELEAACLQLQPDAAGGPESSPPKPAKQSKKRAPSRKSSSKASGRRKGKASRSGQRKTRS